ncbi:MAG: hypothetical protein LBH81_02990 [Rickettsiales bacterium]|jgi:hypothetical protein|nr:hypothetical protein [Rickettsiales bacterium]
MFEEIDKYAGQYAVYRHWAKQTYNGKTVMYSETDSFMKLEKAWPAKKAGKLLEIQALSIGHDGKHKQPDIVESPKYDPAGTACVVRIRTEKGFGSWVYLGHYAAGAATCANYCVRDGAFYAANSRVFRSALASSFPAPVPERRKKTGADKYNLEEAYAKFNKANKHLQQCIERQKNPAI